jgi:hypothetical protein
MKKSVVGMVVALVLAALFSVGCEKERSAPTQAEKILGGEHALRKMAERTDINSTLSGSFFLFLGDVSGSTKTNLSVKFAWKMNDGSTWAISSLPIEKIRVRFDEKAVTPTIRFRWMPYGFSDAQPETQDLMEQSVKYALLTVREKDWPVGVNLPLNNPQ